MKKYFSLAAAALVLASCSVATPDVDDYQTPDDGVTTPEPIVFGSNVRTSTTKAQGPLEEFDANQDLYILGYVRSADINYNSPFIKNVKATSPVGDGAIEVLDASNNNQPFYYNATNAYDFYGYYVDDAALSRNLQMTATSVYLTVNIKGTQDILLAKADPEADIEAAKAKYAQDAEKLAKVSEVAAQDAYSGYAARRFVHPTLKFTHQLARFNYQVVPMTEDALNIKITSVRMTDCYTRGTLYVAGKNVTPGIVANTDIKGELVLHTKNGSTVSPISTALPVSLATAVLEEEFPVGAGLLVIPQNKYGLAMTFNQDGVPTGHDENFILSPDMISSEAESFEAGKQYTVKIKLYGFQKVEISVELTPWEDGGEIEIDEDKKPLN